MTGQLSLFPESPWELLETTPSHARRRQPPDGAVRSLRELAKRGLAEEHLGAAAALVLELDAESVES
jgi:hypothetical protein